MAYQPAVRSIVDPQNSTDVPLGAGATYTGDWVDITIWNGVSLLIEGTAASPAPGTLSMQFSHDAATIHRDIVVAVEDVAETPPRTLGTIAQYFRVVYTNGGVAQTSFDLQTMYHSSQVNLVSRLDQDLVGTDDVNNVRAVITGQQPDGDYVNNRADGTGFTSTSPLGAGGTYTSPWVDTDGFNGIEIFLAADQLSASSGVSVEFTDDVQAGVPVVRAVEEFSYAQADLDRGFLELFFQPRLDGFRVIYTNGSVPQGSFFAQSDLRVNRDATRLDSSGTTIVGDFNVEVALGNIPNYINSTKFGLVKLIDGADPQPVTVWALADDGRVPLRVERKTFQTVANNIFVASNDAADTGVEMTLFINDASNNLVTTTVTLDGADARTPVDTGISGLDCNTAFVSGNDQTLAGDVYVTSGSNFTLGVPNDPTTVLAFVPMRDQRTQQAVFRVPDDQTLIVNNVHSTVTAGTANGAATVVLRVQPPNGSWYTLRPYNVSTSIGLERSEVIALDPGSLVEFYIEDVEGNNLNTLVLFNFNLITG